MKKFFLLTVISCALLSIGFNAKAQTKPAKFGHVNIEHVVSIMPDIAKADSAIQQFMRDSLQNTLPFYVSEYQRKDSIAKNEKTPASIKQTAAQEAEQYLQIIQNWDQYMQQERQRKQAEVLNPFFTKAFELIDAVAKENGYTWVFKQDALMVAPETDDLLPLVAKKLGVKLPEAPAGAPANR